MSIKFSKDHEWINAADTAAAVVGITVHAQDALGDVVFVDLPEVGKTDYQGVTAKVQFDEKGDLKDFKFVVYEWHFGKPKTEVSPQ